MKKDLDFRKMSVQDYIDIMDTRVIGQDALKRSIAVALFSRNLALADASEVDGLDPDLKGNILIKGPTGSGKTEIFRTLQKAGGGWPFAIIKGTGLVSEGIIGRKVADWLPTLWNSITEIPEWFHEQLERGSNWRTYREPALKAKAKELIETYNITLGTAICYSRNIYYTIAEDHWKVTGLVDHHFILEEIAPLIIIELLERHGEIAGCDLKSVSGIDRLINILTSAETLCAGKLIHPDIDSIKDVNILQAILQTNDSRGGRAAVGLTNMAQKDPRMFSRFVAYCLDNQVDCYHNLTSLVTAEELNNEFIENIANYDSPNDGCYYEILGEKSINSVDLEKAIRAMRTAQDPSVKWKDLERRPLNNWQKKLYIEQCGICLVDEFDKCLGDPQWGFSIQKELLTMVEGTDIGTPSGLNINTSGILFIAAGAFQTIGEDAIMPELRGRFPIDAYTSVLDADELFRVLKLDSGALEKQKTLLRRIGIELTITDDGLEVISRHCRNQNNKLNIGVRRLAMVARQLTEHFYVSPELYQGDQIMDANAVTSILGREKGRHLNLA